MKKINKIDTKVKCKAFGKTKPDMKKVKKKFTGKKIWYYM
jgi:hypothetical protein